MGMVEAAGPEETVIVVVDVGRSKNRRCSGDTLKWALDNVVKPRDTVILLAVFSDYVRKSSSSSSASSSSTSCFSLSMGIGFSSIWERLEFSGAGEMEPEELEEEIKKRWEEYQSTLQHMNIYLQCRMNKVKFEVKLVARFPPAKVTIEEARITNPRCIVLDSHFKKDKDFIHRQVGCNVALMNKDGATLKPAVVIDSLELSRHPRQEDVQEDVEQSKVSPLKYPCSRPLSCRPGFPQCVTKDELESITNSFSEENLVCEKDDLRVYRGILCDAPVLVKCFLGGSERFRSEIDILSRVRHRNILNLVGYCCTDTYASLLCDYPCNEGTLDIHLRCDELAKNLSWKLRHNIAIGICECIRYLHEDCPDGRISHLAICSCHVFLSHGCSPLLTNFTCAKLLNYDDPNSGDESIKGKSTVEDEWLSLDVHKYGLLLLELLTGQAQSCESNGEYQFFMDQVLPQLEEDGSLNDVLDHRLVDVCVCDEVRFMVGAALLCLKDHLNQEKQLC